MFETLVNAVGVVLLVSILLLVMWLVYCRRYRRIGPDEALIVYGKRSGKTKEGFRVIVGGGNFLGMSVDEIRDSLTKVVAGHLRTIVAGLSVAELYGDQARFTEDLKSRYR